MALISVLLEVGSVTRADQARLPDSSPCEPIAAGLRREVPAHRRRAGTGARPVPAFVPVQSPTVPPAPAEGPDLERSVALTDGVVAIAMTLLILPLVEVAPEVDPDRLRSFVEDHSDLLLSFTVSFLVIYVFWAAHGTAFRRAKEADVEVPALRRLNLWWLLLIAFLPFPTAVIGREVNTTTAPVYIGTMFVLSCVTSAMSVVSMRAAGTPGRPALPWLTTLVFGLCALLSSVNADLGLYGLLLLVVVRVVEVRAHRRATAPTPSSGTT